MRPTVEANRQTLANRGVLFVAACAGLALFGVVLILLGTMFGFADVRARMGITALRQGWISALLIVGVWAATVIAGPVIDRFGNRMVLALSSFFVAVALTSFAFANSFPVAVASAVLLGFGGGGLNTSTNALVSDLYGESRGPMLNILAMFFGVGALGMPLVAAAMAGHAQTPMLLGAAVISAGVGAIYLALPFPPGREAHSFSLRESAKVIGYPGVLLFSAVLCFESANEQVMSAFTSRWFEHVAEQMGVQGSLGRLATLVLALYQGGMMAGRIVIARAFARTDKVEVVRFCAVASIIATAVMLFGPTPALKAIGVLLTGLAFSGMYPTILAIAGDRYQRFAGSVFGVLFALALPGAVISPISVGVIASRSDLRYMPLVPLIGTILNVMLVFRVRRQA